jgi:hypothetical protein
MKKTALNFRIFWILLPMLALGALAAFPAPAGAEGMLTMGPLQLRAELATGWKHRSNIYLTEKNATSDNIFMVDPTIGVRHKLSETSYWSLNYIGSYAFYQDKTENDWKSHTFAFDSKFGGEVGPYVKLSNVYTQSSDPFGSENQYNLGVKTERELNNFTIAPGWAFSPLTRIEVAYTNLYTQYDKDKDKDQNQRENQYISTFYYGVLPLTSALLQYRYVTRKYPDQPGSTNEDFKRNDVFVGLSWDPSAKINGELKVGYSWQSYDNTANKDGFELEKKDTYAIETNVTYKFSEKLHFLVNLDRKIQESTVVGTNYYTDTQGTLGARWWPLEKLTVLLSGTYGKQEYNSLDGSSSRSDSIYKATAEAEYSFLQYLFVVARYNLDKKDSNKADASYTDHVYFLGVGGRL